MAKDKDFIIAVVQANGMALPFVSDLRNDEEVALAAVRSRPEAMRYVHEACRKSRSFMLKAVSRSYGSLYKMS